MQTEQRNTLFRGLTRNIFVLGCVSLFTDLSSQMVFPLIPLFMASVLGTGAYAVGIVEGAAETTASLLKVLSGYWSDRVRRRKPFVLLGYSLSSVTKPLFAFAGAWPFVLAVRVVERIGKGLRTAPRDAIVAESSDAAARGKAYGFHRAMDGIGSVLGAVCAFLLLPRFGYRNVFLFAFVPGIVGAVTVLLVREAGIASREGAGVVDDGRDRKKSAGWDLRDREGSPGSDRRDRKSLAASFRTLPRRLRLFIFIASIFTLGHFGYAFLLLRAKDVGFSDERSILLYVLFYVVYTVGSVPFGVLSDRIGRKPVITAGYALFGCISLGLLVTSGTAGVAAFFAVYGIFFAMIDGVQRAFVVDLAPANLRATALGAYHTAIGCAALPGGYIAGILWDTISPRATFGYGLALSVVSLALLMPVAGNGRRTAQSP